MVLPTDGFGRRNDGDNEFLTKSIIFTCGLWNVDLGDRVHEDSVVLKYNFCNGLFSTGENGVVT